MSDFPESEKVRILLAEHATLRAEILARTGFGFQMVSITASGIAIIVAIVVALGQQNNPNLRLSMVVVLGLLIVGLAVASWFLFRDIGKAAQRLREIELDVNRRAEEDLLVWENLWGGASTGYWGPARPKTRAELSTKVPPERTFQGKPLAQVKAPSVSA